MKVNEPISKAASKAISEPIRLNTPLTEESVRSLKLGDIVYLSGYMFTARTMFHVLALERNQIPALDFKTFNVMAHCGPVMKKGEDGKWTVVHAGGTTSNRFEKFGPGILRKLGLRAIIGKGTMGSETVRTMKELGAVHLTTNLDRMGFARCIEEVAGVFNLEEFGPTEATWLYKIKDCGPFVVDIDASGNNLFDGVLSEVQRRQDLTPANER